jgi:hypothetical protein
MRCALLVAMFAVCPTLASAQESVTRLERIGEFTKHLTPNQQDRWILSGKAGETVTAHVRSKDFDPTVVLVDHREQVLVERDDPGSESRLAFRLPADGEYEIRVHAYKHSGGGNYALAVERFETTPAAVGQLVHGRIGRNGMVHYRFEGQPGRIVAISVLGDTSGVELLDSSGRPTSLWHHSALIATPGEHVVRLRGQPDRVHTLRLREGQSFDLALEQPQKRSIEAGDMHVLNFSGQAGELRVIELTGANLLARRLIPASRLPERDGPARIASPETTLHWLPVGSKGDRVRLALVLAGSEPLQLQLAAGSKQGATYTVLLTDPSAAATMDEDQPGTLDVGGADFYHFEAQAGQLLDIELRSDRFDSYVRLFHRDGRPVAEDDDGGDDRDSRIRHLVLESGEYRVQAGSVGDGGGGEYRLRVRQSALPQTEIGGRETGQLGPQGQALWSFVGRKEQTVIVSVTGSSIEPVVEVLSPSGALLGRNGHGGAGIGALLAVRLPEDGRHTLRITAESGQGEYRLRLIDGE